MDSLNEIFNWIVSASLRASIVVILVVGARKLLASRVSPTIIYALWLPVLFTILIPAVPLLPAFSESEKALTRNAAQQIISARSTSEVDKHPPLKLSDKLSSEGVPENPIVAETKAAHDVELSNSPVVAEPFSQSPEKSSTGSPKWSIYLALIWATGVFISLITIHCSFIVTKWQTFQKRLKKPADIDSRVAVLAKELGLRSPPKVQVSAAVSSPAVIGFWRYTILLNQDFFTKLTTDEQDFILKHELTHIKRGDLKLNPLLCSLLALHWFNPISYFAFSLARIDREAACDSDVLKSESKVQRAMYGHTLLKMETSFSKSNYIIAFAGMSPGKNGVRHRIKSIITNQKSNNYMKIISVASITFLTLLGIAKSVEPSDPVPIVSSTLIAEKEPSTQPAPAPQKIKKQVIKMQEFSVEIINNAPEIYSDEDIKKLKKRFTNRGYYYDLKTHKILDQALGQINPSEKDFKSEYYGRFKISSKDQQPQWGDHKMRITLSGPSSRAKRRDHNKVLSYERFEYGNWQSVGVDWLRRRNSGPHTTALTGQKLNDWIFSSAISYAMVK